VNYRGSRSAVPVPRYAELCCETEIPGEQLSSAEISATTSWLK
jgi:hypothetical protein